MSTRKETETKQKYYSSCVGVEELGVNEMNSPHSNHADLGINNNGTNRFPSEEGRGGGWGGR